MNQLESVVVAVDGLSKCGKTTVIEAIEQEAAFQAGVIPDIFRHRGDWGNLVGNVPVQTLGELQQSLTFNSITAVSAGNAFRAAVLLAALDALNGNNKTSFNDSDYATMQELLAEPGIYDVLQHDPNIGAHVSMVAKLAGVQALCGQIATDWVQDAYTKDGGGNLVVFDARNPSDLLARHGVVGIGRGRIHPATLMPIYIDTPADVAAERLDGDYHKNLELVELRRHVDATRDEYPVVVPDVLHDDIMQWTRQFYDRTPRTEVAVPYRFDNGRETTLDNIKFFGGFVSATAQDTAYFLHHQKTQQGAI